MTIKEMVKKVSRDYHLTENELLKRSMKEFLLKRKYEIEADVLDVLSKSNVNSYYRLEELVKTSKEHPEWENLIVVENLNNKLKEIQDDIDALS